MYLVRQAWANNVDPEKINIGLFIYQKEQLFGNNNYRKDMLSVSLFTVKSTRIPN